MEGRGIATVNLGVVREAMRRVPAPRNVFVRFRLGQILGEPGRPEQQRAVLTDALGALESMPGPGGWLELPYRWRGPLVEDPSARGSG